MSIASHLYFEAFIVIFDLIFVKIYHSETYLSI